MIRITAPSRLHFGLLQPTFESNPIPGQRRFGGVGLMIDEPGLSLTIEPAIEWSASGPLATRALGYARRIADSLMIRNCPAFRLNIESIPPEHIGLGTGTQLALAVGRAIAQVLGQPELPTTVIARTLERGRRSAIGIHGFDRGGLIIEVGKRHADGIAPLVGSYPLLDPWRIVLFLPTTGSPWHGSHERQAMDRVAQVSPSANFTDTLCRMILLEMLPAALEGDLPAFGEAVTAYNRKVGEAFQPVQGGIYSHPSIEHLIGWVRSQGVTGVGQTSWGPTVFAIVGSSEEAQWLVNRYHESGSPEGRRTQVSRVYWPSRKEPTIGQS